MAETKTARLIPMSEAHLENTYQWLVESERLRSQVDCKQPPTREGNAQYWRTHCSNPTREDYAILDQEDAHVGNCGLCGIDLQRRKAELWIYLGRNHGHGIGSAAVLELLNLAFVHLVLNRISLRVLVTNPGALAFYQKIGFTIEGYAREDTYNGEGFVDSHLLSMLASEYHVKHGCLEAQA